MGGGVDAALAALDSAAQKRLLSLAGSTAGAADAFETFLLFATTALRSRSGGGDDLERSAGLRLLARAFAPRHPSWAGTEAVCTSDDAPGSADRRRQVAVFAAKVTQATLKSCAGVADKAGAGSVAAVDLACCALFVVWTFESDARLGDLVIDNLLYQVAKKYSEVQQMHAQASAACVLACTHIRLWSQHAALCTRNGQAPGEKSRFVALACEAVLDFVVTSEKLPWLVEFPAPSQLHSAQFARLLLGIANTCVTLLLSARQYEGVYKAASGTLAQWIRHLDTSSTQDGKLTATLNDRTFRVLWKCASAVESSPQFSGQISESARLRSLALSFMASCTTYKPLQIILQVYRAGVQMERISKRSEQEYKTIREFYIRAATLLSHKQPESRHIYRSGKLDWEYLQWIEHFASVCENAQAAVESAILLESAVHYVWRLGELGQLIARCLCFVIAGALLGLVTSTPGKPVTSSEHVDCDERLQHIASKVFRELMAPATDAPTPSRQWEKAARVFLKKTSVSEEHSLDAASSHMEQLIPFVTRCLKRGSTKVYSFTIADKSSVGSQLQVQIAASFDSFCSMLRLLRSDKELDAKLIEAVILAESRLSRLGFSLTIRGLAERNESSRDVSISKQVEGFQRLFDDAVTLNTSARVMQSILADLNAIARESYACAARFYQSRNFRATISALIGSFEIGESFLEYVMCSELSPDEVTKMHQQLKMDTIASLLAYCYREIGDTRRGRIFSGHSVLYCCELCGFSETSIDKYVASLLEECSSQEPRAEPVVSEFDAFIDSIVSVYKARHFADTQLVDMMHTLRRSFQRASDRTMVTLRANKDGEGDVDKQRPLGIVSVCARCEHVLDVMILRLSGDGEDKQNVNSALLSVCTSVAARKVYFSAYYVDKNAGTIVQSLLHAFTTLSTAIESLQHSSHAVELAVAYGWRGVLGMEVMLTSSYSGASIPNDPEEAASKAFSEDSALCDFKECLAHLTCSSTTALFNTDRVICCLEAVCETLSLISCPAVEATARQLLHTFQGSSLHDDAAAAIGPLPSFDLIETCLSTDVEMNDASDCSLPALDGENASLSQLFRTVDEDIACAISIQNDVQQVCRRLRRAASRLNAVKAKAKSVRSLPDVYKAIAIRQVILHIALSDIGFAQGKTESAFADAKAALAISWKLSKKFTSHSSVDEHFHFKLPAELSNHSNSDVQEDSSVLLYFKALEFSSWDILTGAKVALCRIATLYCAAGQPRRAAVYYAEAMRLVGGLRLTLFNRDPFCHYAQLQLKSGRPQQARIALGLIPRCLGLSTLEEQPRNESSSSVQGKEARSRFGRQQCIELIQYGDLAGAEGDLTAAHTSYTAAIQLLTEAKEAGVTTHIFQTLRIRCWRKLVKLQAKISAVHKGDNSNSHLHRLLSFMKELRAALEDWSDSVEQVKGLLELGRQTLDLAAESRAEEVSIKEAICLLERAFARGSSIGIGHLSKKLRIALGSAYHMQLELLGNQATDLDRRELCFLSRASGVLLANASSVDIRTDGSHNDGGLDSSAKDYFTSKLDELAIQPVQSRDVSARTQVETFVNKRLDEMRRLPASWLTVAITVGPSSELLLTRLCADDASPITFRLSGVRWEHPVSELQAIVEESRVTLSGHSAAEANVWTADKKKKWWSTRKQLDIRMGDTIVEMQTVLGFWRCLLVKASVPRASDIAKQCWDALRSSTSRVANLENRLQTLLRAIVDASLWLSDGEVDQGLEYIVQQLDGAVSPTEIPRVRESLKDAVSKSVGHSEQSVKAESLQKAQVFSSISKEAIRNMKVGELKELLSAAELDTSGLKKDLLERLLVARDGFSRLPSQAVHGTREAAPPSELLDGSTIMILDRCLLEFPWEGIDVLSACSGVTRMPSLDLIVTNASRYLTLVAETDARAPWEVNCRRVRYILNPSGDLKATQRQLGPILERNADALGWEGIVGCAPDPHEFRRFLIESDLLIYCGHGSGEKYLHREKVRSIESGCSAALLFGCSSGRLESEGVFEPDGAVLSYLHAGSPGVLAMLWDVTDKDIDQLSVKVLQQWLLPREDEGGDGAKSKALAHVVQASRGVCKLQYLNGHAAVCYGLPLHVAIGE